MLLVAAEAATWVKNGQSKVLEVEAVIYADDRALVARGEDAVKIRVAASEIGDRVNEIFGHQEHQAKLAALGRGEGIASKLKKP